MFGTMPIQVPQAVQQQAVEGLTLHERQPIRGVGGLSVARALRDDRASDDTIRRMRRFFAVNGRAFENARQLTHTAHDDALVRSWKLHGGQSGRVWSEGVYRARLSEGEPEDSWVDLLRTPVPAVYERLGFGAWTWEYGMDARSAARFVDHYSRANGVDFRYDLAFGESADTVKQAVVRRVNGDNPFKQLARLVVREGYAQAARKDLEECTRSLGGLEGFRWPELVALSILGAHDAATSKRLTEGAEYPWRGREPRGLLDYPEALSEYVMFLHPRGPRYLGQAPNGLSAHLDRLMWQISEGEVTDEIWARDVLQDARRWMASLKAVSGLGHTLLEAWDKRDWGVVLDALPLDSTVRPAFESFRVKTRGTWLAETGL